MGCVCGSPNQRNGQTSSRLPNSRQSSIFINIHDRPAINRTNSRSNCSIMETYSDQPGIFERSPSKTFPSRSRSKTFEHSSMPSVDCERSLNLGSKWTPPPHWACMKYSDPLFNSLSCSNEASPRLKRSHTAMASAPFMVHTPQFQRKMTTFYGIRIHSLVDLERYRAREI